MEHDIKFSFPEEVKKVNINLKDRNQKQEISVNNDSNGQEKEPINKDSAKECVMKAIGYFSHDLNFDIGTFKKSR